MLEASGNRLLVSIGMPLMNTFWALGSRKEVREIAEAHQVDPVAIHAAYLDAIRNRDFSHTREVVDRHLLWLCSRYGVFPCGNVSSSSTKEEVSIERSHIVAVRRYVQPDR